MRYSIKPQSSNLCLRLYRFLSFAKIMGKNQSKNKSGKNSQKRLDLAAKSATDALAAPTKPNNLMLIQRNAKRKNTIRKKTTNH